MVFMVCVYYDPIWATCLPWVATRVGWKTESWWLSGGDATTELKQYITLAHISPRREDQKAWSGSIGSCGAKPPCNILLWAWAAAQQVNPVH